MSAAVDGPKLVGFDNSETTPDESQVREGFARQKPAASFGWRASVWARSVEGVPGAIASAILALASHGEELYAARELAKRLSSANELAKQLRETQLVEALANCLFPALKKLQSAKAGSDSLWT